MVKYSVWKKWHLWAFFKESMNRTPAFILFDTRISVKTVLKDMDIQQEAFPMLVGVNT